MKLTVPIVFPFLLVACLSCGDQNQPPTEPADPATVAEPEQCGPTWDLQHVESYDGTLGVSVPYVAQHQLRVGWYYASAGSCTGTLVSDDLFISAGHCKYAVGKLVFFNYQLKPDGTQEVNVVFHVSEVVEQEYVIDGWDYAIVRLANMPGREFGHATIAAADPPVGGLATIIQHADGKPKQIGTGQVVEYPTARGGLYLKHKVDTAAGSSGAGVLDLNGRLIAIHTDGGCATGNPIGNQAIRMSQLVTHSPTLQALTQGKIVWTNNANESISIWTVDSHGNKLGEVGQGPFTGWRFGNYDNNRIFWKNVNGMISLWKVDAAGNRLSYKEYGPFYGWTALNYASNRLLWKHTDGRLSLWRLDDGDNLA